VPSECPARKLKAPDCHISSLMLDRAPDTILRRVKKARP
jgi:hypothetical protein